MKRWVALVLVLFLGACQEDLTAESLMASMKDAGPEDIDRIVADGVEQSNGLDAFTLMTLSTVALKKEDYFHAELFMFMSMLRAGVDKEIYPPVGSGGDSPTLVLMAMRQSISQALQEGPIKSSDTYQALIHAFENWEPHCDGSYLPGWDFSGTPDYENCRSKFTEFISNNVENMKKRLPLYEHPEYFTLLKDWQELNMQHLFSDADEISEAHKAIQEKLALIESEASINGEVSQHIDMENRLKKSFNK